MSDQPIDPTAPTTDDERRRFEAGRARVKVACTALVDALQTIQDEHDLAPRDLTFAMLELVAIRVATGPEPRFLFEQLANYHKEFFEMLLEDEAPPERKPS